MDSLTFALNQISNIVTNLNKKNFKASIFEISQLVTQNGSDAEFHLYRNLFSAIDFSSHTNGSNEQRASRDSMQAQYLSQEMHSLIAKPNFVSLLCYAVDKLFLHQRNLRPSQHLFNFIGRTLRLSCVQEVTLGLALLNSSNDDIRVNSLQWVCTKLPELLRAYVDAEAGNSGHESGVCFHEISIEVVHQILALVREDINQFGISNELLEMFLKVLCKDFPKQRVPVVLSPLLYPEVEDLPISKCFRESGQTSLPQTANQSSLSQFHVNDSIVAEIMEELGYNCTATLDDMRITLAEFNSCDLISSTVASCIIMFMRTCDGSLCDQIDLHGSVGITSLTNWKEGGSFSAVQGSATPFSGSINNWNVENFMTVVKEINSSLSFAQVVRDLDQDSFMIETKGAFFILKQCLFHGHFDSLAIELFYRPWKNATGHLSFFSKCLLHPDIICLAYWRYRATDVSRLKQLIDEENRDLQIWRNIDFIEALLRISDQGLYAEVKSLFHWPQTNCPDLLALSLVQSIESGGLNILKQELLNDLFLFFLQPHVNSSSVFQCAWTAAGNSNAVRTLVLNTLVDWYQDGITNRLSQDYTRINRILDVIVDLKALNILLSSRDVLFCVDLACLAAKRDYLKLEKWLTDRINEGGEPFLQIVLHFLACRCPRLMGQVEEAPIDLPVPLHLPASLIQLILQCLQFFQGRISVETRETLNYMICNCTAMFHDRGSAAEAQARQLATLNMMSNLQRPIASGSVSVPAANASYSNANSGAFDMHYNTTSGVTGLSPTGLPGSGVHHLLQNITSTVSLSTASASYVNSQGLGSSTSSTSTIDGLQKMSGVGVTSSIADISSLAQLQGQQVAASMNLSSAAAAAAALTLKMNSGSVMSPATAAAFHHLQRQVSATVGPIGQSAVQGISQSSISLLAGGAPPGPPRMPPQAPEPSKESLPEILPVPEELRCPVDVSGSVDARKADDSVNNLMASLFRSEVSAETVLARVKDAFGSEDPQQKEFYRYFMKIVSEEFVHIPVQFPETEATLMAHLYGGIINEGVTMMVHSLLSYFIRLLWTAVGRELNTAYDERMFVVGITAFWIARVTIKSFKMLAQKMMHSVNFHLYPRDLREIVIQTVSEATSSQFQQLNMMNQVGLLPPNAITNTNGLASNLLTQPMQQQQLQLTAAAADSHVSLLKVLNSDALVLSGHSVDGFSSDGAAGLSRDNTEHEEVLVPSESVQDRIFFIFNNVSQMNISTKAAELKEVVPEQFMPWLGQYLVMKRVTTEPNFHHLFVQLIEFLDMLKLKNMVKDQVFRNIRALLRNMKPDLQDFNDRTLLKNLGRFLGLLTLAKNRPILFDEMNFKDLLLEAYRKGQVEMHYVVPFVARTLEGAGQSTVFKPPNPWTMGIIRVLKELHMDHNVKMNLKFEVEILCKNLSVNFETLEASFYLRDPQRLANLELEKQQCMVVHGKGFIEQASSSINEFEGPSRLGIDTASNSSGFPVSTVTPVSAGGSVYQSATMAGLTAAATGGINFAAATTLQNYAAQSQVHLQSSAAAASAATTSTHPATAMASQSSHSGSAANARYRWQDINVSQPGFLQDNIMLDESLPLFQAQPVLRSHVRSALEHAITELLVPVSDRCVRITMTTVENIVRKDFALDHDEHRMRQCAHNMARFLTAGMALITIREALALNMVNRLKNLFLQALRTATQQQKELVETTAAQIASDNTELGTAYIQKCCVEKALQDLDQRLAPEYAQRIKSKEEGRHFFDQSALSYQMDCMPHKLRKKIGDPALAELAVYNEYAHTVPGFAHAVPVESNSSLQLLRSSATNPVGNVYNAAGTTAPPSNSVMTMATITNERTTEVAQLFEKIVIDIERQMQFICQVSRCSTSDRLLLNLRHLSDAAHLAQHQHDIGNANDVIAKTVYSLFECYTRSASQTYSHEVMERYKEAHLNTLRMMTEPMTYGYSWVCKHVLKAWINLQDELKWNSEAFLELLKIHVINLLPLDSHLCKLIVEAHLPCLRFIMELFYRLILTEQKEYTVLNEWDLTQSMDALNRLVTSSTSHVPEELLRMNCQLRALLDLGLLEQFQQTSTSYLYSGCSQAREFDDPPGLSEKSEILMKQWFTIYNSQMQKDIKSFNSFVQQMHLQGILKTDDLITRFFRLATDYVVERCLNKLKQESQSSLAVLGGNSGATRVGCYVELDAFIRLVSMLVKHSGEQGGGGNHASAATTKVNLLNKVLGIICGTLLQEHDIRSDWFHPMPFQRILIMLFMELNSSEEQALQSIGFNIMAAFANALHIVRPSRAPAFTFSWLEIVAHRLFIGRYLQANNSRAVSWPMYAQLMLDLMKFLQPFLVNALLPKSIQLLYKGTLRIQLVLMHDFPDFICEYHSLLCDVIPPNCIQLRNLVLSAFPKGTRLQDPFMPSLRIDAMPEVQRDPQGPPFDLLEKNIQPAKFLTDLDSFLVNRQPVTFLTEMIRTYLRPVIGQAGDNSVMIGVINALSAGSLQTGRYNMELINATVLHVGRSGIRATRDKNLPLNMTTIAHTPQMDIFQSLVINLDTEGRYLVLNAIVNQLRYPNSHTFYFNQVILYLFHEVTSTEAVQEQITRVLLERLIVARPHPWGLLVTFVELMRNPIYKFWERPFLRCASEIEKLLETVWRSCRPSKIVTAPSTSTVATSEVVSSTSSGSSNDLTSAAAAAAATLMLLRSSSASSSQLTVSNGAAAPSD